MGISAWRRLATIASPPVANAPPLSGKTVRRLGHWVPGASPGTTAVVWRERASPGSASASGPPAMEGLPWVPESSPSMKIVAWQEWCFAGKISLRRVAGRPVAVALPDDEIAALDADEARWARAPRRGHAHLLVCYPPHGTPHRKELMPEKNG